MDKKLITTAVKAGKKASEILAKGFGKEVAYIYKESGINGDVVTKYDLAAQKAILKIITDQFPDHSLLAEEGMNRVTTSPYQWIIDPLDGTGNFSRGIAHFSSSIGLAYKNKLILGVIAIPAMNELFVAAKGQGAYRNNKRIHVSKANDLRKSMVTVCFIRSGEGSQKGLTTFTKLVKAPTKVRVTGSVAADLARLAMGANDAVVFNHMNPWDIAAGTILVQEAGGKVSGIGGKPFSFDNKQMIASNKGLHNKLLKLI
jgi:myo-inositol-1(or 4)-monophosphatase